MAVLPAGHDREVTTAAPPSLRAARAHNMGSEHDAVCVPARAMLHSGRSLFHLDGPGGMTTEHPTLPERFGEAGYRTFGTGKWHNGREAFNRCYDEGPQPVRQTYERYASGTDSSELFAGTAIEFIGDHHLSNDDRPFFAYAAFMAPHDPRTAPGRYHAMFDPLDIDLPESFREKHPFDNGFLHGRDETLAAHPRDPDEIRRHIADYYAMIAHLDAQVGRILDALERTGRRENTLVVFTADHGLAVGRHGLLGKQNVYDHSVRVPLIFSGPGISEAERPDAFTYHHDLYPTLGDLAGIETPDPLDGESLSRTIREDADGPRDAVFSAYSDLHRSVRTDRYKLIEYYVDGDRHTQLFDVARDPAETDNIAGADHGADLQRLRAELAHRRDRLDDPMLAE